MKTKVKVQICPEAITISSKGNLLYVEILEKVKTDPDLAKMSTAYEESTKLVPCSSLGVGKTSGFRI